MTYLMLIKLEEERKEDLEGVWVIDVAKHFVLQNMILTHETMC